MKTLLKVLSLISVISPKIIQMLELIKAKNTKALIDFLIDWSIELMDDYAKTRNVNDWKEEQFRIINKEIPETME